MSEPLDEVAFLANSANRCDVLQALAADPRSRRELVEVTDASRPTVGRILGDFERRNWVERTERQYKLTALGRLVMQAVTDVLTVMETEQKLRTAVQWIPTDRIDVDLELFADANVSTPEPGSSHQPINRFIELVEDASSARGFGIAILAPMSAERLFRRASAGMDTEIIYPSAVLKDNLLSTPEAAKDAIKRGHLTPMVHESLPCGLYIFDDHVILGGYNRESGVLRVVVDTDDPEAVEWADAVYTTYRREADPFDLDTLTTTGWGSHIGESN